MPARLPPAYLVVPALTLTTAAVLLVAVATPRTLIAARLLGGPTPVGPQSLRLQCVRRAAGVDDTLPLDGLTVEVDGEPHPASCDADGHAEIALAEGRPGPRRVRVTRGAQVLAEGAAQVGPEAWRAEPAPAALRAGGTLPIRARALSPLLVGHTGEVLLLLEPELRPAGALRLSASGATLGPARPHPRGLVVPVRPTFFTATLDADEARAPAGEPARRWQAALPVLPGGLGPEDVALAAGQLTGRLRSTSPRAAAFVQVNDRRGRRAAARVALAPDGRGGAWGAFSLALPAVEAPAWLLASSAPGASALAWPLDAGGPPDEPPDPVVAPDVVWVDGLAPARQREHERVSARLVAVGAVVLCGGLLEALLLALQARTSRLALARHLAAQGDDVDALAPVDDTGRLRPAVAIAVVLFGFAIVGSLLLLRPG